MTMDTNDIWRHAARLTSEAEYLVTVRIQSPHTCALVHETMPILSPENAFSVTRDRVTTPIPPISLYL